MNKLQQGSSKRLFTAHAVITSILVSLDSAYVKTGENDPIGCTITKIFMLAVERGRQTRHDNP